MSKLAVRGTRGSLIRYRVAPSVTSPSSTIEYSLNSQGDTDLQSDDAVQQTRQRALGWKATLVICGAILLAGTAVIAVILSTEPTATRETVTKKTAMPVAVIQARSGTFRPTIVAMGTVQPAQDIVLRPRVSGEIVERSDDFVPGGFVDKGDVLLQLDRGDYAAALHQRNSELRQAEAQLEIEQARQAIAERGSRELEQSGRAKRRELVLRRSQVNAAKGAVEAARAAVEQAELNLQRTTIKAPFDAHVLSRNVNIGSQVSAGDELGRLVGNDTYWVETTVPVSKLNRLSFPDNGESIGSQVRIRNRTAWPEGTHRIGHLYKLVGELEQQTRMARVLVAVEDPLAREPQNSDAPHLMIGAYVENRIQAAPLKDVVKLERDYLRQEDTVWVMGDGKLDIRDVQVVFRDNDYAYISAGLSDGERVVTSNLATVDEGAPLRLKAASATAKASATTGGAIAPTEESEAPSASRQAQ